MAEKIRIAIAKGNIFDGAVEYLAKAGIEVNSEEAQQRKLVISTNDTKIEILLVRNHDVPIYVEYGAADFGIVGSDILLESEANVMQLEDLGFSACRLCVCAKQGKYKSITDLPNYARITTSFPQITKKFFKKQGLDVEVIKLYGSVELGPITGLSDVIVDLVASGKTLKENGLEVIQEIIPCTARLIANKVSYRFHSEFIQGLA